MKIIIMMLLGILPLAALCQDMKEFKASNGKTYHVGDTVKVGMGSMPDGNFKYIQITPPPFMPPGRNTNSFAARREFAMSNAVIRSIKMSSSITGSDKVMFRVKAGGIGTYDIFIAEAIAACEVTPCSAVTPGQPAQLSIADEIAKLKKLLDEGAITKAEYEKQKKKLLGE